MMRVSEEVEGRITQVASGKGFSQESPNDEKEPPVLYLGKWKSASVGRSIAACTSRGRQGPGVQEACGREAGMKDCTGLWGAMKAMAKKLNFYSKCHMVPLAGFKAAI